MEVSLRPNPTPPATLINPLAQVSALVQSELDEVSARIGRQAAEFDPAIEGYVSYALQSSGKRLRPLIALLSAAATGPVTTAHVDLAVIVELIHLATLVHDDIMDEAERRRGQPTLNARWGNALSVLLGDSLFAHALDLSTRFDDPEVSRMIARATRDVCTGEIVQTQRRFDLHLAVEDYLQIIALKTATLFAVAAELGAKLNRAPAVKITALKTFGMQLGTAYQIYDDCLDVAGHEETIGKTLGTDLRKGKMTLPTLRLLRNASAIEKERYCQLILEGDADAIRSLLQNSASGAMDESIAAGMRSIGQAQQTLAGFEGAPAVDALRSLADTIGAMLEALRFNPR